MVIGPSQCFFVVLLIAAFVGLSRGFMREVVTMAIILASVLFLLNGGNGLLHQFLFVNMPNAFRVLIFGDSAVNAGTPVVSNPNPTGDYLFGLGSFLVLTALAYLVGHRYGQPAKTNQHRLGGMLPGLVNGAAIAYYASNTILPSTTVNLTSPTDTLTRLYLPIIFGFGLLALVLVLVVSSFAKK